MTDISSIIDISVSIESPGVTKPGFGIPLLFGYSTVIPASTPVLEISTATWAVDMLALGFVASDPHYIAAGILASQDPKPRSFKINYSNDAMGDHDVDLLATTFVTGETLEVTIYGEDPAVAGAMTSETYSRTAAGGSLAAEATAIAALIQAGIWGVAVDIVATGVANNVEIRGQAGFANKKLYYGAITNIVVSDQTAVRAGPVETILTGLAAYDADFYAVVPVDACTLELDTGGAGISNWANGATNKVAIVQSQDSTIWNAGTGIMNTLRLANQTETMGVTTKEELNRFPNAAVAGRFLPKDPGTTNWCFKPLTGVLPSSYTTAELAFAQDDFCNTYDGVTTGGVETVAGMFFGGWTLGSSVTFMDMIRLRDAMVVEVQTEILSLQMSSDKIPFNDTGIATIQAGFLTAIRRFEGDTRGFTPGSAFCNVPTAASVSAADRAARNLPGISFGATANGAIITVVASGSISV